MRFCFGCWFCGLSGSIGREALSGMGFFYGGWFPISPVNIEKFNATKTKKILLFCLIETWAFGGDRIIRFHFHKRLGNEPDESMSC
jgi:hypothetical protein